MTKLISWNVNGLRAVLTKGFEKIFKELSADVFCLQEIKLKEGQTDFCPDGYFAYWNYAEKAGYSGTALFTKTEPISVSYGIGIEEHDTITYNAFFSKTREGEDKDDEDDKLLSQYFSNVIWRKSV